MSHQDHDDPIIQHLEVLLHRLNRQGATEAGINRQRVRPIRTWDEQTRHLRFADKVKLHRYPGGLANTTRWRHGQRVSAHRQRIEGLGKPAQAEAEAIHEAMAYALDAERFLGSLDRRDERDYFPVEAVDELAERLLVWLEERGYRIGAEDK